MKAGWQVKPIGELCEIVGGGTPSKSNAAFFNGSIPWATVRDMKADWIETTEHSITAEAVKSSATNVLPRGTVVIASRVGLGKVCRVSNDTALNQDLRGFIPKSKSRLETQYLFWWFKSISDKIVAAGNGATVQGVTLPFLRTLAIPLPPLDEQRQIVAVLDKAFEGIASATANTQKSLTNARSLFESRLNDIICDCGRGAKPAQLASYLNLITYGFTNPMPTETSGPYMVTAKNVTGGRIDFQNTRRTSQAAFDTLLTDKSRPIIGDVLLTKDGTLGRLAVVDRSNICINQSVALLRCNSLIEPEFLFNLLRSRDYKNEMIANSGGTTIKHIYITRVDKMFVRVPDRNAQHQANALVESLSDATARLVSLTTRKLAALTELKRSLLHKAFAGELNATIAVPAAPVTNDNFLSPQFTAQVIAFAHRRHEQHANQKTFGHVKAQKGLHLVESIGGIDLGRQPIKDAAGPNDMQHMLRATNWASQQGFFEFAPRASGNGYDFRKLANYDALWAEAVAATRPVAAALETAIDPIVPMVSLEAELFATVHAAWNNLIRDRAATTDDAIVTEARENWHSSKLTIPEQKFRSTIKLIRAKGLEPDGSAKYVGGQVKLI